MELTFSASSRWRAGASAEATDDSAQAWLYKLLVALLAEKLARHADVCAVPPLRPGPVYDRAALWREFKFVLNQVCRIVGTSDAANRMLDEWRDISASLTEPPRPASFGFAVLWLRRRRGSRSSVWTPPCQRTTTTISPASTSTTTTSQTKQRTIRFFNCGTLRGAARSSPGPLPAPWSRQRKASLRRARRHVLDLRERTGTRFQRVSSPSATMRFAGSTASYWRRPGPLRSATRRDRDAGVRRLVQRRATERDAPNHPRWQQ